MAFATDRFVIGMTGDGIGALHILEEESPVAGVLF